MGDKINNFKIKISNIDFSKVKSNLKKGIKKVIIAIIIFSCGVAIGIMKPWRIFINNTVVAGSNADNNVITAITLRQILKPASDLISMKYCYTDADYYEHFKDLFGKKIPFTTDRVVFTYNGVVSAGIDLSLVEYEIDNELKSIVVKLPEIKILSNEIDASSFEFPYESNSIFTKTDMDDYMKIIDSLKEKKVKDIKSNDEFMKSTLDNTKNVIKSFLTLDDSTKEYTVNFE